MDPVQTYREIIKQVILKYAKLRPSHGDIHLDPVVDETHDNYALMQVGWDSGRRIRGNLLYVTIREGKVHIEYDGMEQGIAQDLLDSGIRETDLKFSYLPEIRVATTA